MRTDERAMDEVVKDSMFELDNLSAYLAKVRDMTRADYEHTPLHIRTFDLRETVDKLIRLVNVPTNKKVTIHPHYEMKSTLVTADPVHIANIIICEKYFDCFHLMWIVEMIIEVVQY